MPWNNETLEDYPVWGGENASFGFSKRSIKWFANSKNTGNCATGRKCYETNSSGASNKEPSVATYFSTQVLSAANFYFPKNLGSPNFHFRELNHQLTDQQKAAVNQLNTLRILMRNVKACNSNASERLNPKTRTRFNYAETPTEHNVTAVDLGHVIMELAAQVRQYSENLMRLGDQMIKERFNDLIFSSKRQQNFRSDFQ